MERAYHMIDLVYDHTVGLVFGYFTQRDFEEQTAPVIALPGHRETLVATPSEDAPIEKSHELAPVSFKTLSTVIEERAQVTDLSRTVAYIGSAETPIFATPTKEFDTVITKLSYGTMVMVLEEKGRFSKVAQDGLTGWVLREDLADRAAYVFPEFVVGNRNMADDPNTLRVRAYVRDVFHGGETEVALQAGEYVLYKLMRKGLTINWPPTRPRTPGRWHQILRGVPGIYIGVTPKTGSIMECTLEHDMGHVAYVESVFPDDRISISEANYPDDGTYSERTLTKDEWTALNPIFIQVS